MGIRREAREKALQFLFQHDLNPAESLDEALRHFWDAQRLSASGYEAGKATWGVPLEIPPPDTRETSMRLFAEPLIRGVIEHREDLDGKLRQYTRNWDLKRMAVVDRNVMRLAVYELFYRDDIPPVVTLNEAIEIAKRFSTRDSGRFVNGILDRIRQDVLRPSRTPVRDKP